MNENKTLDALLNLFEDDEQFEEMAEVDGNGEGTEGMDNRKRGRMTEIAVFTAADAKEKPARQLVPIDFQCSRKNNNCSGHKKIGNGISLLHSNDADSSEDEWDRHFDQPDRLSDVGRDIKRQLKNAGENCSDFLSSGTYSIRKHSINVQDNRRMLQEKAQQITQAVESSSKDALRIYDPFFGIRIRNPTLSSAAFESYCDGLKKIRLGELKAFSERDSKWISLAIIVEKTSCRKSASGHEYMIWNVSDLANSLDKSVRILVFGDCVKKFWKLQLGTVIALVTPPFADSGSKQITVKLTKCAQVLEMGFCPDFGHCKAIKKDGSLCQNLVNLSQCERCIYHVQRAARKFTANRGSFTSALANPKRKLPLQESNSFGISTVTGPKRVVKVSTNTLSINDVRKNIKQKTKSSLTQSKSLKEYEKKTLNALIEKEAEVYGTRSVSQQHGKILAEKKNDGSLKEFLQKEENGSKSLVSSPVLGKGLNSGTVLLTCPTTTFTKLNVSEDAKRKAIAAVIKKGGVEKADPNSLNGRPRKRRLFFSKERAEGWKMKKTGANESSSSNSEEVGKFSKTPYTADEILALMKKKSSHESDLHREDAEREGLYFHTMEQKEKLENYLTNTMEIRNCNVVICIQCNYKSHKQSDLCKQLCHTVKQCKASKRFFRCKQCHRRTISYERIPAVPCTHCGCNDFQRVSMKDERKIKLPQEDLLLRGEERKYVNC